MPKKKNKKDTKYIFITGGIVSGIGKGITTASISTLLSSRGVKTFPVKIDPYLNRDAGTMNPFQHGEVFVLDDGTETDLDLGHYERFTGLSLDKNSNFTTGSVYESVMKMERRGDFLGKTIQIIPHVTDEIKRRIIRAGKQKNAQVVVTEIGGTVGDIEAEPFLEAARQIEREHGRDSVIFIHVVKLDYIYPSEEEKTKPIQQSVKLLRSRGIQPTFLVVRCKKPLSRSIKNKISLFTSIDVSGIIDATNVDTLYEVPLNFRRSKFDDLLIEELGISARKYNMKEWGALVRKMKRVSREVKIALVGKYTEHGDAYISVEEAVRHAALHLGVRAEIVNIDSESKNLIQKIKEVDGIIIPGGFGKRGVEGKIKAAEFARKNNIPFLGLCLGLQIAVIEFSRHVARLKRASSTEFDEKTPHPVVCILPEQEGIEDKGGTMRLGASGVTLKSGTKVSELYNKRTVYERHRHRWELNPEYHKRLEKAGLVFSGFATKDKRLVDFIELPEHRFFVGTQAHPEFKSRFLKPHPLFLGLVDAAKGKKFAKPKKEKKPAKKTTKKKAAKKKPATKKKATTKRKTKKRNNRTWTHYTKKNSKH